MANKNKKKKKLRMTSLICKGVVVVILTSMVAGVISNQMEIAEQKKELDQITQKVSAQVADNEELRRLIEGGETEMLERVAREQYGYAAPNERVFVDMSGK